MSHDDKPDGIQIDYRGAIPRNRRSTELVSDCVNQFDAPLGYLPPTRYAANCTHH